ncbi:MAG: hypothetical protein U1E65_33745 [Myxococcota bacterium]
MRRVPSWILGAFAFGACAQPAPGIVALPGFDAQSWIFAVGDPDATDLDRLQITAVAGEDPLSFYYSTGARVRIHALGYDVSLAELGLSAGPLGPAASCERRCAVARPLRAFEIAYDAGRHGDWSEVTAEAERALLDDLVPDRAARCSDACLTFTATAALLGTLSDTGFLIPETMEADGTTTHTALLGMTDGSLLRIGGPVSVEHLCGASGPMYSGAYDPRDKRLYTAGYGQEVGVTDLEGLDPSLPCPRPRFATLPSTVAIVHLSASVDRPPGDLFVLSATGAIGRLSGGSYRAIGHVANAKDELASFGGFLLETPEAVYFGIEGDEIATLRGDHLSLQRGFTLGFRPTQAQGAMYWRGRAYFSFLHYQLFTALNGVIVPLDGRVTPVTPDWSDPRALQVFGDRIIAGLGRGFLAEWTARKGYCAVVGPFSPDSGHHMLNIQGNAFVPDGDPGDGSPRRGRWMQPDLHETCP